MFARDGSKLAGSEARGEGRERGNLIETTPKPPVTQRAGGTSVETFQNPMSGDVEGSFWPRVSWRIRILKSQGLGASNKHKL